MRNKNAQLIPQIMIKTLQLLAASLLLSLAASASRRRSRGADTVAHAGTTF